MYGDLYRHDNVLLASTHTHSGPGGFLQYVLYIISTQGFNKKNFQIIVTGILRVCIEKNTQFSFFFLAYLSLEIMTFCLLKKSKFIEM